MKSRFCETVDEAMEDVGSVTGLAITWTSDDRTPPTAAQLRKLKRLTSFTAHGLKFDTRALSKLPLTELELHTCRVPDLQVLSTLPKLVELSLVHVKAKVPPNAKLPKLEKVDFTNVGLTDAPPFLWKAKGIYDLSLNGNRLTSLPNELGRLATLRNLSVAQNRLREFPDIFAKTPKLDSLWLDDNRLEQLPESIGLLKNKLTMLSVARNPLTKNTRVRARLEALLPKTKIYWR